MTSRPLIFALRDGPGYVNGTRFVDSDLKLVPGGAVVLNLEGAAITDEGIWQLPSLPELRCLDLDSTNITDQSLGALSRLPQLEELWLECTSIGDAGLRELHACKQLRFLSVAYTSVTQVDIQLLKAAVPCVEVSA